MHISIVLLVCCTFSANGAGKKIGEMEERLRSLENSLTRTKDELNSCYKQLDTNQHLSSGRLGPASVAA